VNDNPRPRRVLFEVSQKQRQNEAGTLEALYHGQAVSQVFIRCGHCDRLYRVDGLDLSSVAAERKLKAAIFSGEPTAIVAEWLEHLTGKCAKLEASRDSC
jgi:hypothetical protein